MRYVGAVSLVSYVGSIFLANWLLVHAGTSPAPGAAKVVSVGFGLMAPAGVFAAGFALVARDLVQRYLGRRAAVAAILVGAALSLLVSPAFALASAAAFLVSELVDMAVYTPLERRTFAGAMLLSNTVGLVGDSVFFLLAAFASLAFLPGQVVGKLEMTLPAVLVILLMRRVLPAPSASPA